MELKRQIFRDRMVRISMIIELSLGPLDPENAGADYWLERLRLFRDGKLTASDWTQLADSQLSDAKKAEWANYRQQLRDFPATWTPAATADLPEAPA